MIATTTLRPGLLVGLKTHLKGNVSYATRIIEDEHLDDDGAARETWETERTVADPIELEAAKKARSKAAWIVRRVCANSAFGLLCPADREDDLEKAIAEAREVAAAFNAEAKLSNVTVYVMTGRVAADDVEAVKAIKSEVRDLMDEMQRGIKNLDVKVIRDAADKARSLGQMLSPQAKERVEVAIDVARKVARQIKKAGDAAEIEIDQLALDKITSQRSGFLDMEEVAAVVTVQETGRAVEMEELDRVPNPEEEERIDRYNDAVAQDVASVQAEIASWSDDDAL